MFFWLGGTEEYIKASRGIGDAQVDEDLLEIVVKDVVLGRQKNLWTEELLDPFRAFI